MFWPVLSALLLMLQAAAPATVRLDESPASLRLRIDWPAPVRATSSSDGRELLLRFDGRLTIAAPENLPRQAPAWIEAVSVGFDTMLIRAARDVTFAVSTEGTTVTVEMMTAPVADSVLAPEQEEGARRLELLNGQLLVAEGRLRAAEETLTRFVEEHPSSAPGQLSLAQVEVQRGRWRAAERRLRDTIAADPANEDAATLLELIDADQASRARADYEIKEVESGQRERSVRLSGHARLTTSLRLVAGAERRTLNYLGTRSERDRGEVSLQADLLRGTMLRGSGLASRGAAGAAFSLSHPDAIGRTLVQVDYRRAFWEYVESIQGDGTRDRIELRREQPVGPRLALRGAVAANRYGVSGIDDAARSLAAEGGVTATLWPRNPIVALDYALDIESRRALVDGTLPLVSREVHALGVNTSVRFARRFVAEAFAGYARDRLGGRGPFSGARLTHGGASHIGFDIWIDRRLHAVTTTERVTRAGASFIWRVP